MQHLLAHDDAYWRQRAKTHWYRDGDRNTKKNYALATARKKVYRIISLEDDAGNKITDEQGLHDVAKNYFVYIFQKQGNAEVDKIVTRKGGLNCDPLKILLKLKSNSQVVYLE